MNQNETRRKPHTPGLQGRRWAICGDQGAIERLASSFSEQFGRSHPQSEITIVEGTSLEGGGCRCFLVPASSGSHAFPAGRP